MKITSQSHQPSVPVLGNVGLLPAELMENISSYIPPKERRMLRTVNSKWFEVVMRSFENDNSVMRFKSFETFLGAFESHKLKRNWISKFVNFLTPKQSERILKKLTTLVPVCIKIRNEEEGTKLLKFKDIGQIKVAGLDLSNLEMAPLVIGKMASTRDLGSLREISLKNCEVSKELAELLVKQCKKLQKLDLASHWLNHTGVGLEVANIVLKGFGSLRILNIEGNDLTSGGMYSIEPSALLRHLDLGDGKLGPNDVVEIFEKFPNLVSLNLSGNMIGGDTVPIKSQLRKLRVLDIGANRITEKSLKSILENTPSLEKLSLESSRLGEKEIAIISNMPHLRHLVLKNCTLNIPDLKPLLQKPTLLETLNLEGNDLEDGDVDEWFLEFRRKAKNLQRLQFPWRDFTFRV